MEISQTKGTTKRKNEKVTESETEAAAKVKPTEQLDEVCNVSRLAEHSVAQYPEHQGVSVGVGCQRVGSAKSMRKDTRHHETHQAHETVRSVDIEAVTLQAFPDV